MTKHMKFTTLTALLALSGGVAMAEEKTTTSASPTH